MEGERQAGRRVMQDAPPATALRPEGRRIIRPIARTGLRAVPILLACLLVACATPQERIAGTEGRLAIAGFRAWPSETPQFQAMLEHLPPHRLVRGVVGANDLTLYADPLVCGCLYVGSEMAYGRYRQRAVHQERVDEPRMDVGPVQDLGGWAIAGMPASDQPR